eukprot:3061270-Rhodomonas_salina.1
MDFWRTRHSHNSGRRTALQSRINMLSSSSEFLPFPAILLSWEREREDETEDSFFYSSPRLVYHQVPFQSTCVHPGKFRWTDIVRGDVRITIPWAGSLTFIGSYFPAAARL